MLGKSYSLTCPPASPHTRAFGTNGLGCSSGLEGGRRCVRGNRGRKSSWKEAYCHPAGPGSPRGDRKSEQGASCEGGRSRGFQGEQGCGGWDVVLSAHMEPGGSGQGATCPDLLTSVQAPDGSTQRPRRVGICRGTRGRPGLWWLGGPSDRTGVVDAPTGRQHGPGPPFSPSPKWDGEPGAGSGRLSSIFCLMVIRVVDKRGLFIKGIKRVPPRMITVTVNQT